MTRWRKRCFFSGAALAAALLASIAAEVFAEDAQPPSPPASAPAVAPPQPAPANRPGFIHQLGVWWDQATTSVEQKIKGTSSKTDDAKQRPDNTPKAAAEAPKDSAGAAPAKSAPAAGDAVNSAVDATKGAAASATDAVKGAATNAGDAVKGAATTAGDAVKGAASNAGDAVKGAFEATKNAATTIVKLPNTRVVDIRETCAKAPNGASDCTEAANVGCRGKGFSGGKVLEVRTAQSCDLKPLQPGNVSNPLACGQETTVIRAVCQ
jgi:hypothetical protein